MEWVNVADSAVKIGLGALIAGITTYLTVRARGSIEKDKIKLENKLNLIQEACQEIETGFSNFESFNGYLSAQLTELIEQGIRSPEDQLNELEYRMRKFDDLLTEGKAYLLKGVSKLTLAGFSFDDDALRLGHLDIFNVRDNIASKRKLTPVHELHEQRLQIKEQHASLQKQISEYYSKLDS